MIHTILVAIAVFIFINPCIGHSMSCSVIPNKLANSGISSSFSRAVAVVIRHEGSYSNDASDKGGPTKYGISLRYLQKSHVKFFGEVPNDNFIKNLTLTEADLIYYRYWWEKYDFGYIKNQLVATKILDFSVNAGAYECALLVQRSINLMVKNPIPVNGLFTTDLMKNINAVDPNILIKNLINEEISFYKKLVKEYPSDAVFLSGWITRAKDLS